MVQTTGRPLRIGIDGRALTGRLTGVGRYTTEICKRLHVLLPTARFYVYAQQSPIMPLDSRRWVERVDPAPYARHLKPIMWLKLRAGELCRRDGLDVFWGSATFLPALRPKVRSVSTVCDLNYRVVPDTLKFGFWLANRLYFPRDVVRADKVVCISQGSADRLRYYTGRMCQYIARPGVDDIFCTQPSPVVEACKDRYGIDFRYLLSVATWEPRKNLRLVVETFIALKRAGSLPEHKLVLVGGRGWKDQRLASLVESAGAADIHATGYVPDADLPALYTGADVFVFPSRYEGFGIPVAEARACGTRVVTSDIPELREAGGPDQGVEYVQPSAEGLRDGIMLALGRTHADRTEPLKPPCWETAAQVYAGIFTAPG